MMTFRIILVDAQDDFDVFWMVGSVQNTLEESRERCDTVASGKEK